MDKLLYEMLKDKKVFIFDFDGTLTDTERFNYLVHKKNLVKYGIDLTEEDYKKYIGRPVPEYAKIIDEITGEKVDFDKLVDEYVAGFMELTKNEQIPLFDYAKEIFETFPTKEYCILSNQHLDIIRMCLNKWGISDLFKDIVSLTNSTLGKSFFYENVCELPSRAGYNEKSLNLKQSECVVFEDGQRNIDSARNQGILTVGVKHKYASPSADFIIDCINQ